MTDARRTRAFITALLFTAAHLLTGCSGGRVVSPTTDLYPGRGLKPIRFTIQVGAFTNQDNAVGLTESLQADGFNAYHFIDESGLYKVRFGNYSTRKTAQREAETLVALGVITDYYIVSPQAAALDTDLRDNLVRTARSFIGIPYKWGGESADEGFDCSGLTMTVYQLNGLDLPRTSRQQWKAGTPVDVGMLERGDLVFFATAGGRRISHVGIYAGDKKFIHAPSRGKTIRVSSLTRRYYRSRLVGARRYL
jgi:cell wall-associated NlpC family hydrolase